MWSWFLVIACTSLRSVFLKLSLFFSISSLVHFYIFFHLLKIILPSNSFLFIPCYSNSNQFPRTKKDPFFYRSLMSSPPEGSYKVASTQLIIAWASQVPHFYPASFVSPLGLTGLVERHPRKAWTYFMQHYNITMMILTY